MKLILVDVKYNIKHIIVKEDVVNDIKVIYLNIPVSAVKKLKRSIYSKLFNIYLKFKIHENEDSLYILSKEVKKYSLDKYFKIDENFINYLSTKNSIEKNSIRYLENESSNSKVLIVKKNVDANLINNYICKFKHVSVYVENKEKCEKLIKNIELENGLSINIYDKYSNVFDEADFSVYFDDMSINGKVLTKKNYFFTHDILDKFSTEYDIFSKYRNYIKDVDRYSLRNLAFAFSYLHNFK